MLQINLATREVITKIVYCGPTMSGKTGVLRFLDSQIPDNSKGKLLCIAGDDNKTLFFDHLPITLGEISGLQMKFFLYTVPGQSSFILTRKNILSGADGIVFVADSDPDKMEENKESLKDISEILKEEDVTPLDIPFVFQYNKQDLPNALSPEELNRELNPWNFPYFPTVLIDEGKGVRAVLKAITEMVLENVKDDFIHAVSLASQDPSFNSGESTSFKKKRIPRVNRDMISQALDKLLEKTDAFKISDLKKTVEKVESKRVSRRALTRQLNNLIEEGQLKKKGYGKGTVYYIENAES